MAEGNSSSRDIILDAAVRSFLSVGFEAVSMEAVAAGAGVARRTVFNQFGTKEALFSAAVERLWDRLDAFAEARSECVSADAVQALTLMARRIVDFWEQPEAVPFVRLVISEGDRFAFLRTSFVEGGRTPTLKALTECFEALNECGRLRVADPELAALQFVSMIKDVLWWPVLIGEAIPPDADRVKNVADAAIEVMLRAYAP